MDNKQEYEVELRSVGGLIRYVAIDSITKEIINDANGYGFKTSHACHKAMWYKNGGKKKIHDTKADVDTWCKNNKAIVPEINKLVEYNFKEILSGQVTTEELAKHIEKEFNVIIPKNIINYLFKK